MLLVGRTRHAKPGDSITCDKWKNVLATVGTRQRKTEGKDVYCTIRGSTGTMEGNLQAFSPAITCRTLHSQLGYDNLHLADLRHGKKNLLAAVTLGSLTCPPPDRGRLHIFAAFFIRARSWVIPLPAERRAFSFWPPKVTIIDRTSESRSP